ncbi:amidohydrolase family protein [bacterium]|nr:amidohydrolase family protein [bacterium]
MSEKIISGTFATSEYLRTQHVKFNSAGIITEVGKSLGIPDFAFDKNHLIFSGFVDVHVHAREDISGQSNHKETFLSASRAALNGGVIAIADMPNNAMPPINDDLYKNKENLAKTAEIPILLYAGISPNSSPLSRNVPYKLYMGQSVGDLFFRSEEQMEKTLSHFRGCSISFHCEDFEILRQHQNEDSHEKRRPKTAETRAIRFAINLTKKFDLNTTICHLSTAEGLRLCNEAKKSGLNVAVEVSPHHLFFDLESISEKQKKLLQVNPPIRNNEDRISLLKGLISGGIDYLATDHAPHLLREKESGISGIPHLDTYGLFVAYLIKKQGVNPKIIARVCSENPGLFFNRFCKIPLGKIQPGYAAKFTVLDFAQSTTVEKSMIRSKCGWSPFESITFPARVSVIN